MGLGKFNVSVGEITRIVKAGCAVAGIILTVKGYRWKIQYDVEIREERRIAEQIWLDNTPLATGQAWSHCMGYSRMVLPELGDKIRKSKFYSKDSFPVKEFNIIPQSAKTVGNLAMLNLPNEYQLEVVGQLEPIKASRGSYKDREYNVTVYSITDPSTLPKKKYHFVAHIPYALSVLGRLEEKGIITKDKRIDEIGTFRVDLPRIVDLTVDDTCKSLYSQVYIEEHTSPKEKAQIILNAITDECQKKESTPQTKVEITNKPKTIYIDYDTNIREDKNLAEKQIKEMLEREGYTVLYGDVGSPGTDWKVVVLSKKRLEQMHHRVDKWMMQLDNRLTNKARRIVVLMDDLTPEKCPDGLQSLVHLFLRGSEATFKEQLLKEVSTDHSDIKEYIPESAYRGLAYAYVLNYLEKSLDVKNESDGFDARLYGIHADHEGIPLYKKLLLLIPKSSLKRDNKGLDKDKNNRAVLGFEQLTQHISEKPAGGMKARQYQLIPYLVQENRWQALVHPFSGRKQFIVVAEYPNPLVLLSEIQQYAHWTDKQLQKEVDGFVAVTNKIIEECDVRGKVCLLSVDEEHGYNIRDVVMEFLKKQEWENKQDFLW